MTYVLKTERLGLRGWQEKDLPVFSLLNQDERVMKHFPGALPDDQVRGFFDRLVKDFTTKGYCYFAADLLATGETIGMIGLLDQSFESEFTPCVDIGWRIVPAHWRNGYALEGASAVLKSAKSKWNIDEIYAFATLKNKGSITIMERLGMEKAGEFIHPKLLDYPDISRCVAYRIRLVAI